jgi:hypothetical protein
MSAKGSLGTIFHAPLHEDQPQHQPRNTHKRPQRKTIIMLLNLLSLLALLALLVFTRFFGQKPTPSPRPLKPVGDIVTVTAPGFDTCVAPPADLLQTWWDESPYRWLNVYLGGVSMFHTCGGKNLTPAWVSTVYEQGWSLLPTWVGPQAPCAVQHTVMSSNPSTSYAQGQAEADAAIRAASRLGFASTAPIYFDMEHFNSTRPDGSRDNACIQAVNAFLKGWTSELTTRNHPAGVYASASNYPVLDNSPPAAPTVAWIAGGSLWAEKYDRACTVYGNRYLSDTAWNTHQRIYQYTGGHNETYGQKTWNIDSDCADAPMVGHITTMSVEVQFQHP